MQSGMIRLSPKIEVVGDAIKYLERLWDALTHHGYGEAKEAKPSHKKDWFNALPAKQKKWFTDFWNAFNYKQGRNEAAMAWGEMGHKTDQEYLQIINAATKESQRILPQGQARMMAQGWINKKRFMDYQPKKENKTTAKNQIIRGLNTELIGLKILYERGKDEALLPQIKNLEQAISDARR